MRREAVGGGQWLFCKTRTTRTLASETEIGFWVQEAPGASAGVRSVTPEKSNQKSNQIELFYSAPKSSPESWPT